MCRLLAWTLVLTTFLHGGWCQGNSTDKDMIKCYDKWGCMLMGKPFVSVHRPVNLAPAHPDQLQVRFALRSRERPDRPLVVRNVSELGEDFVQTRPTVFIIHGYLEHGRNKWIHDMSRELLTRSDHNVLAVDWGSGAVPPYAQATANARMAGRVIADFISNLQADLADVHLIGHGLGAHVAGYVGEASPGLGRITGLDPSQPHFQSTESEVRLDPRDATFVDVIHSDSESMRGQGDKLDTHFGHVDFYPNYNRRCHGGGDDFFHGFIGCDNQVRAYELFTESINTECPFYGYACESYDHFVSGRCMASCGSGGGCAPLGYRASDWRPFAQAEPTKMYLLTGNMSPYCRHHYTIQVKMDPSAGGDKPAGTADRGRLFVRLTGSRGQSPIMEASREYLQFSPGSNVTFMAATPHLGRLLRADLEWKSAGGTLLNPLTWRLNPVGEIRVESLEVRSLEEDLRTEFIGRLEPMKPSQIRTFFASGDVLP